VNARAEDTATPDLLVVAARAEDEAAVTGLVAAHDAAMLRVAFVITGDADLASDAAQRAWGIA
jgi:DNA-directed RNA polymerase specialized sigma24 family protein